LTTVGLGTAVRATPREARSGDALRLRSVGVNVGLGVAVGEAVAGLVASSVGVALALVATGSGDATSVGWAAKRTAPIVAPTASATPTAAVAATAAGDLNLLARACLPPTDPSLPADNKIGPDRSQRSTSWVNLITTLRPSLRRNV
jgi:hypothetical protein